MLGRSAGDVTDKAAELGLAIKPRTAAFLLQLLLTENFEGTGGPLGNYAPFLELQARVRDAAAVARHGDAAAALALLED